MDIEKKIEQLLTRSVEEIIEKNHLETAIRSGKKLRVKHGIDPTGEKIHIGRAVVLSKLKEFQELGHTIVLIIGDFTAQIGDPSDKLEKRPFLTPQQIKKNLKNYLTQIGKIINLKKTEVCYNSEWLGKLKFQEIAELAEIFSVQQMVRRRNFTERWEKEKEISLREFLYPLMQGYDSVAVKADLEIGGSDQLFNLLAGRKVQEYYGQKPQDIMTLKMLMGLDGRKMSTSWGNVINIVDTAREQYGKIMSIKDAHLGDYIVAIAPVDKISELQEELKKGINPKLIKEKLAFELVRRYHGEKEAKKAAEEFTSLFSKKNPEALHLPTLKVKSKHISVLELILLSGVPKSKSEARRLIEQGACSSNGEVKKNPSEILKLQGGEIIKVGKKDFFRMG